MSLKKIDANLVRITTNGDKLNVLIHQTAMLIMKHATKSGDCTRALALVKAMPASMRRTTLIAWFTKYSPIRIVFQNDAVGMLKKDDKGYTAFALDKAEANPFYKIAENNAEPGLLDFDKFIKMIQGMAKREAAKADEGKVKPEDVASIKAACEMLASLKFQRIEPANDEKPADQDDKAGDEGFGPMPLAAVA
jgi:hypothetical protein